MKRFIIRASVFLLVAVLSLGAWTAFIVAVEISSYGNELKMPEGKRVLVCGDSQPAHALNPEYWPELFNFSRDATLLDQSRMKMKDVLAANPGRTGMVLIDVSPWKFYVNDPVSPLIAEGPAASQMLVNFMHSDENVRPLSGLPKAFRDTVLIKKGGKLHHLFSRKKPYRSNLKGGFVKTKKTGFADAPERVAFNIRRLADKINAAPRIGAGTVVFDEWRETVRTARAAGVERVVLITTPFHSRLRDAIDPTRLSDFSTAVRAFARETGCEYLDFLGFDVPDDGWRDANHLNVVGARLFTDACRKAVSAL